MLFSKTLVVDTVASGVLKWMRELPWLQCKHNKLIPKYSCMFLRIHVQFTLTMCTKSENTLFSFEKEKKNLRKWMQFFIFETVFNFQDTHLSFWVLRIFVSCWLKIFVSELWPRICCSFCFSKVFMTSGYAAFESVGNLSQRGWWQVGSACLCLSTWKPLDVACCWCKKDLHIFHNLPEVHWKKILIVHLGQEQEDHRQTKEMASYL